MKKQTFLRITAMLLLICLTVTLSLTASAAYPTPKDSVYDETSTLSETVLDSIKSTNDALYDKVKARIALCIVKTLGDDKDIATYARNIFSEWKLGEGVLLVVFLPGDADNNNYYAVQSVGIDDVLTNDQLSSILQEFLEPDFSEGNVERGIQKTVNKLSGFLKTELAKEDNNSAGTTKTDGEKKTEGEEGEKKVTFGSIILSIFKIILWVVIILVVAFVAFFVVALFNDTAAELMQKYIFARGRSTRPTQNYYDERLYGSGNTNRPQNRRLPDGEQRRLPSGNGYNGNYPQQRSRQQNQNNNYNYNNSDYYGNGGYNQSNRPRNNNQRPLNQYEYYGQQQQQQQYRQSQNQNQNRQNQNQNPYDDNYEYTRPYNINTRQGNNNNRR